jgi:catechol 2,3-dioxygenase-like lactoylglutathione lyase family enzyme
MRDNRMSYTLPLLSDTNECFPVPSSSLEFDQEQIVMTTPRIGLLAVVLAVFTTGWTTSLLAANDNDKAPDSGGSPRLVNTCLITNDVKRLVEFYEPVLGLKAKRTGEDYAEFPTGVGVLAIFSEDAQERYIPGSAEAAKNKSVVLQFRVADVDQEYRRLQSLVKTWVKPPTTQPWGTRSIYFRDPDGNLVDFYAPSFYAPIKDR